MSYKKINAYDIENFKITSTSVDPANDTPLKMKEYAQSMNIDLSNWVFLTGPEQEIFMILFHPAFLAVGKDDLAPGGVFHSPSITIVDKQGYIRTGIDKKKTSDLYMMALFIVILNY